jgi:hypothetical protein
MRLWRQERRDPMLFGLGRRNVKAGPARAAMRFVMADPALRNNLGHHANSCRRIAGAFRARGVETKILGHVEIGRALRRELGAAAHFRVSTYWLGDGATADGWLTAFHETAHATAEDLARLDCRAGDIVFFNSVLPAQLMGCIEWMASLAPERRPLAVVEFGVEPGLEVGAGPDGPRYVVPPPEINPRPTLLRLAGRSLPVAGAGIHLATFHPIASAAFASALERPVAVLPFPYRADRPLRNRGGKRPITIAALGHQSLLKGYHLLPEIAERLLASSGDTRMFVHNGDPGALPDTDAALRRLAAANPRFRLDERRVDWRGWNDLLDAANLILCPYEAGRYRLSHSGLVAEALANAIPLIVPDDTALASLLNEYGGAGASFAEFSAAAIVAAVERVLGAFDHTCDLALAAARRWEATQGPDRLVDAILALNEARTGAPA